MYGSNQLPAPLQDKHSYQMLVAKLRQKADRDNQQKIEQLKDSKLSQHTTQTDAEPTHPHLIESTGGYVSPHQVPRQVKPAKRKPDGCSHSMLIGDKCVANCRECGIFIPKVRASINPLTDSSSLSMVQSGVRSIRNDNQAF